MYNVDNGKLCIPETYPARPEMPSQNPMNLFSRSNDVIRILTSIAHDRVLVCSVYTITGYLFLTPNESNGHRTLERQVYQKDIVS